MDKLALCSFYLVFSWKIQGSEWPQNTQSGPRVRDRWAKWDNRALTAQQAWQLCRAAWAFHTFLRELRWIPFLTHSYACCPCNASKNAAGLCYHIFLFFIFFKELCPILVMNFGKLCIIVFTRLCLKVQMTWFECSYSFSIPGYQSIKLSTGTPVYCYVVLEFRI